MSGITVGTALAIGIGVTGVSTIVSSQQASKAAKAQAQANAAQQRAASASAQRERIKAMREARMAAGGIGNMGALAGMGQSSSGIAGSLSSIGSQAGSTIANINVQEGFAGIASAANQRAANHSAKAATWQQIGAIGGQVMSWGAARAGAAGTGAAAKGPTGPITWT